VSFYGIKVSGSQRWINLYFLVLQPSELMKIAVILCLAKYYHRINVEKVNSLVSISFALTIIIIPIILVLSQPDLGTSVLIACSGLIILWLGGVKIKYFFVSFITFLISLPFIISYLQPYQKLRILTFLDPDRDPLGAGYQIIQSKIAIGSGGFSGKGFLQGTQSYLDFLPEKHTDFIFTLFSEEFGFIGSTGLLLLYTIIIIRIVRIGVLSRSSFAKLFCFGFAFAIFIYITVNLSMVLGLLPIVGSPLPIMSYGGSSMLATMVGFGIVLSAKIHSKQVIA
jgi:rod shape determining protein RodA